MFPVWGFSPAGNSTYEGLQTMELSKHNIIGKLEGSGNYFIVNPLSRQADIITPEIFSQLEQGSWENPEELQAKGYLVDPREEQSRYNREYLDFIDARDDDEIQLFYVPTYSCNFGCSYCYQEEYPHEQVTEHREVIDAFFKYIDEEFRGRRKYLTIFGGEPLLSSQTSQNTISYLIQQAAARSLDVAVVTNGWALEQYIPILKQGSIREIQVTLDGPPAVHDSRRMLKGGGGTFSRIASGIDAALKEQIPVNLRVVVDRENFPYLKDLADIAIQRGWTSHQLFKTQLGRNYELHTCQSDQQKLYDRVSLYQDIYHLVRSYPRFLEFHRPAFSISKFLFEHGELPQPLFDSCPGCKTEWAFDYSGKIYSCTATVGMDGQDLGTFYPVVNRKQEIIDLWEERDVRSIPECSQCSLQLACGGGCAAVAQHAKGSVHTGDCRPVRELMGYGLSLYFNE